jgi:glycosyltransferase involved in cell wall biosynthesis
MDNPWGDVRAAGDCLLELEQTFSPDIIHLNGYAHGALPWKAPTLVVCHSCVLSWWKAVHSDWPLEQRWDGYRDQVAAGLRAANFVVAPTQAMLSSIENCYGAIHSGTAVVRNGLRADLFQPATKQPYIFSAGRLWDPAKNTSALQQVADRLDWPVYAAGNTLDLNGNCETAESCPNYHSLGFQTREEIARWLSAASIYCAPARYEPFGLAILEAAVSGCALVLGDIPSLRELWDGAAVFVDPNDTDAIATALRELAENSTYREKCGRRARLRGQEFTPARMAAQYESIYQAMQQKTNTVKARWPEAWACA